MIPLPCPLILVSLFAVLKIPLDTLLHLIRYDNALICRAKTTLPLHHNNRPHDDSTPLAPYLLPQNYSLTV